VVVWSLGEDSSLASIPAGKTGDWSLCVFELKVDDHGFVQGGIAVLYTATAIWNLTATTKGERIAV
jgi:hypothetical protein